MPTARARLGRRPSSSSYSSTITTIIFVSLCVLGVWLLTSTSVIPPKSTTRTSTESTTSTSSSLASTIMDAHKTISNNGRTPVYKDTQGDLPDDAIKPDDANRPQDTRENDKPQTDVSSDITKYSGGRDSLNGNGESLQGSENGKLEDDKKNGNLAAAEHSHGLHGIESVEEQEKQKLLETQTSEESSITHRQEAEQITAGIGKTITGKESKDKGSLGKDKAEEDVSLDSGNDAHGVSTDNTKNILTDQEQQKRLEQHQQQEDDQMQQQQKQSEEQTQGVMSKDQIKHDEAPILKDVKIQHDHKAPVNLTNNLPVLKTENHKTETIVPKESKESKKSWSTQADHSVNQKERRTVGSNNKDSSVPEQNWQLCEVAAGADYIPCLDNEEAIQKLKTTKHYEHRERHCPQEPPTCLVPLPQGYKTPIEWPKSRDKIWYHNVPHTLLAEVKGHQNWVKVSGEFLTFPGGGTQFIHGALHYIDFVQEAVPDIAWGKHTRVVLDVGCGVASFGGYLFERDVLAMSFAPKDEHEAQVQFALERGIPAISAVMGTQRLPFPSGVFDLVHCARCRVPWHEEGGALLLELNRVLRPGGYFAWSATPVYQTLEEDVEIWKAMSNLTVSMCWELITIKKDKLNSVGVAIYHKPDTNDCYDQRKQNKPPMCKPDDDPNAAWYVAFHSCIHRVPTEEKERGYRWPVEWPERLQTPPYWLNQSQVGIYGKPAPDDFAADLEHWKRLVSKVYMNGLGISWSNVRNAMDMRAVYGGFAAALRDLKLWVLNVVNVNSPDTLPIIYERGLFGIYHDWCESFSTYPRTYDLLHADHLFSQLKKRCKIVAVLAEIDRIVRPGGYLIVRDDSATTKEVENLLKSLHWEIRKTISHNQVGILSAQKTLWRPSASAAPT
ncbi:probable methyltransferase PMT27 [Nicotiana sylvestris]|uniref:Probable methyltransferase PMT27 n=1 Tax=Nicotiana sylvestris TaxID=4096 RepID=A0A1U7Y3P1_NICSY|nr:PREDICTED: probable methyltransferase PMT27 [Nicotiana sylvestris]